MPGQAGRSAAIAPNTTNQCYVDGEDVVMHTKTDEETIYLGEEETLNTKNEGTVGAKRNITAVVVVLSWDAGRGVY